MIAETQPTHASARAEAPVRAMGARRRWLPAAVLVAGGAVAAALVLSRPAVPTAPPEVLPPAVRVVAVETGPVQVRVSTQGTVEPRTESDLVAETAGRVTWVSPALAAGGFFETADVLLRLDSRDHEITVERASAAVARAESEEEQARRNLDRRRALADRDMVSRALLEDAEHGVRVAGAAAADARAVLSQAKLDLERTAVRAPFAGRVRATRVDVGQFVAKGAPLARLFAADHAEVRLPVADEDLGHIEIPLGASQADLPDGPPVVLRARLRGRDAEWAARVVRAESAVDPQSRMLHLVARLDDPYARAGGARTPLPIGTFVDAEIVGRTLDGAAVIPRAALRDGDQVLVVDADDRLRFRPVELAKKDRTTAIVSQGLSTGERVLVSSLETVTEGMRVRPVSDGAKP